MTVTRRAIRRGLGRALIGALAFVPAWHPGAQEHGARPPEGILGEFEDDYGIRHAISAGEWRQHSTRYRIVRWRPADRYLIARDESPAAGPGDGWTRIDWMPLVEMEPWEWAFCITAWERSSAASAEAAEPPDRDNPRTGCGGHPFSRMRRLDRPEGDKP